MGTRVEGRLGCASTLHTAGCNYASGFSWPAPPLCCHTVPFPPANQPTNQPKTMLHLELKMCIPLPCSPVGKDSFCPFFLPVTNMSELGLRWLNFSNRVGTGAKMQTSTQEVGASRERTWAQGVSI